MPKFKLTPALDRLSDPLWQRSQPPHETCYVVAANEQKAREALRMHLGPRHKYLPAIIADQVVAALRLSGWLLVKKPPNPPHSTPGE